MAEETKTTTTETTDTTDYKAKLGAEVKDFSPLQYMDKSDTLRTDPLGFGESSPTDLHKTVRRAVQKALRPELCNRLDEIVVFDPLDRPALEQIAALRLQELQQRLSEQGIEVEFSPDVAREAVERGYDRRYGARAVRRVIEKEVASRLAERILSGDLPEEPLSAAIFFPLTVDIGH